MKLKGFLYQKVMTFKEDYFRCNCGALLADEDYATGEHAGHRSMYATYVTLTELIWIKLREFYKYQWKKLPLKK